MSHPMLNIAVRAARSAGNVIVRHTDRLGALTVSEKGRNDFVSEVDRQAEQEILRVIHRAYPGHAFLAEESGAHGADDYVWIVDPLDGTTNFLHGFPHYAVSIALRHRSRIEHAVVYDPLRQELFTASRGNGAFLNDRRIRVTQHKALRGALLGTGFPFKAQQHLDTYLAMFRALFPQSSGVRRAGSAALDLAYVAAGRLDGFWELALSPWDVAAGALLVQEAGGMIGDFEGEQTILEQGHVLAANPRLFHAMLSAVRPIWRNAAAPAADADAAE